MKSLALLLVLSGACGLAALAQPPPNIVILYADDMGFGDLRANNPASKIPTPQLDRLAAQGVRFTDAHSSSGVCTPSRYALLTGRYHWRDFHGISNSFGQPVFKPGQLTLPRMLQEKGYSTAIIGKWHLGWDWNAIRRPGTPAKSLEPADFDWSLPVPGGPLDQGFDHYFGDDVINFPPYTWIEDRRILQAPDTLFKGYPQPPKEGSWESRSGPGVTGWDPYKVLPTLTQKTIDYLVARRGDARPFFLFFSLPSPHAPIIPNDEFDGISAAGAYGDFVAQTDAVCGRILDALERSGHAANTIVLFTADNGSEYYAWARDEAHDHWSSAPLRGVKRDLYEGGHRVPTLLRWPGVVPAGTVSESLFSQIDLMATIASLVDYALPADAAADSFDFLPYWRADATTGPRRELVHNTYKDRYALRVDEWVLIDTASGTDRPAPESWNQKHGRPADDELPFELYNLREDPGQRHDLAAEQPERVATMQARLRQLREQTRSAPGLVDTAGQE